MVIIKIMNDYLHSPLWTYEEDGIVTDDLPLVRDDKVLQSLSIKITELFTGYYEFNSHGLPCWFNSEQEKRDKNKMLALLTKLNARLAEINDGSFVVEDLETPRVQNL